MREIVAKRYAKALIQIGVEDGQYEQYGEQLRSFQEVLASSDELREVMENPVYNRDQKRALFGELNKRLQLHRLVVNFIFLLIEKRRLGYFDEIVRSYDALADEVAGRTRASVVSAVALPEPTISAIRERLASMTGKDVIVSVREDPSLIGGVVTKIGDVIYDGSLRTQLETIKETLMKG